MASQEEENHGDQAKEEGEDQEQIRIFVAGDRASVGKSTICLGLLGVLLQQYDASSLAYLKPATQSEQETLVAAYCQSHGIACRPVGPIVYYRGFTRSFLEGRSEWTRDDLLQQVAAAADDVAQGAKVVLLDGVGYPAVGSICGTDNAATATACGIWCSDTRTRLPAPVLLVGKSGVGDAVDSYNLNASYFQSRGVAVLGGIFNKLATNGYYSVEKCRTAVTSYFDQYKPPDERPFGFLPQFDPLLQQQDGDFGTPQVEEFIHFFDQHVDVAAIVKAAREHLRRQRHQAAAAEEPLQYATALPSKSKRDGTLVLTRDQIEAAAMAQGAAAPTA